MHSLAILGVLCASVVLFNIYATIHLLRSSSYSKEQKKDQIILIWVLPVLGGCLVLLFLPGKGADGVGGGSE